MDWLFVIIVFIGILIYKIVDRYLDYKEFINKPTENRKEKDME